MTVLALISVMKGQGGLLLLLGYIGPDVFLPVTSALAAIAGVLLMFWQKIVGFVMRLFGRHQRTETETPVTKSSSDSNN